MFKYEVKITETKGIELPDSPVATITFVGKSEEYVRAQLELIALQFETSLLLKRIKELE